MGPMVRRPLFMHVQKATPRRSNLNCCTLAPVHVKPWRGELIHPSIVHNLWGLPGRVVTAKQEAGDGPRSGWHSGARERVGCMAMYGCWFRLLQHMCRSVGTGSAGVWAPVVLQQSLWDFVQKVSSSVLCTRQFPTFLLGGTFACLEVRHHSRRVGAAVVASGSAVEVVSPGPVYSFGKLKYSLDSTAHALDPWTAVAEWE
jgi:hypothetical protein